MTNVKNATTEQLVQELLSRSDVTKVEFGLYKPYELKAKYGADDISGFNTVILLDVSGNMPDN